MPISACRRSIAFGVFALLSTTSTFAVGQSLPVIEGMSPAGSIPGFAPNTDYIPYWISDSGNVIGGSADIGGAGGPPEVGFVGDGLGNMNVIEANPPGSSGMSLMLPNQQSRVTGGTADGSVVVGYAKLGSYYQGFRWTAEKGMEPIGTISGAFSFVEDVSADGNILVGASSAGVMDRAFRWIKGTGFQPLGALGSDPTSASYARGVSDDGQTVVGFSYLGSRNSGLRQAFRWTPGTGMVGLADFGGPQGPESVANDISADGQIVVGWGQNPGGDYAGYWDASNAAHVLPTLSGAHINGRANATNGDGSVIVGYTMNDMAQKRAVLWGPSRTVSDLGTLKADNSGQSEAMDVTADGTVVVGWSDNDVVPEKRAFIWRAAKKEPPEPEPRPEPKPKPDPKPQPKPSGGTMLDHQNTLNQIAGGSSDQAAGAARIAQITRFALGQEIAPPPLPGGGEILSSRGTTGRFPVALRFAVGGSRNGHKDEAIAGGLTLATAVTPNLTLGGYLGLSNETSQLDDFGIIGNFKSVGLYVRGGQAGAEGLSWKVAAAHTGGEATITRSTALANTEAGQGETDMKAQSASVELAYGMRQGNTLITPFARITRAVTTRDGFTESNNVAFPVTYDDYKITETVATLGATIGLTLSAKSSLSLGAGVEWDLSRSENAVTGISEIPGMTTFAVAGPTVENDSRLFATARYVHQLQPGRMIDLGFGARQTTYSDKATFSASIGYTMSF